MSKGKLDFLDDEWHDYPCYKLNENEDDYTMIGLDGVFSLDQLKELVEYMKMRAKERNGE